MKTRVNNYNCEIVFLNLIKCKRRNARETERSILTVTTMAGLRSLMLRKFWVQLISI